MPKFWIQCTTKWWSVDTSPSLFIQGCLAYSLNSDGTTTKLINLAQCTLLGILLLRQEVGTIPAHSLHNPKQCTSQVYIQESNLTNTAPSGIFSVCVLKYLSKTTHITGGTLSVSPPTFFQKVKYFGVLLSAYTQTKELTATCSCIKTILLSTKKNSNYQCLWSKWWPV